MSVERVPPPSKVTFSTAPLSFSRATATGGEGRWVHVSGQIAREVGGGLGAEAAQCFDQIDEILRGLGGSLGNVVRVGAYLTGLDEYADYNRVRGEKFGDALPASTAIQVAGLLGGASIEIDAVAFLPA